MDMKEKLDVLTNTLEEFTKEYKEKAAQEECDYLRGRARGCKQAYELCAKWIKEIVEEG